MWACGGGLGDPRICPVDILLIDDEPDLRQSLRDVLTRCRARRRGSERRNEGGRPAAREDVRRHPERCAPARHRRADAAAHRAPGRAADGLHPDDGVRRRGPGRGRAQGGRVGLPDQALRHRRAPAPHRSDRQHAIDAARARRGAARAGAALPEQPPRGPIGPDDEASVPHRDDRAQRGRHVDHGRERHGQGARGAVAPRAQPAREQAVRGGQLRRVPRDADRGGAVRLRTRRLHGGRQEARGTLPRGGRRNAVPGRDRRAAACPRRPSCCASCRMERSSRWARTLPSRSTCA